MESCAKGMPSAQISKDNDRNLSDVFRGSVVVGGGVILSEGLLWRKLGIGAYL